MGHNELYGSTRFVPGGCGTLTHVSVLFYTNCITSGVNIPELPGPRTLTSIGCQKLFTTCNRVESQEYHIIIIINNNCKTKTYLSSPPAIQFNTSRLRPIPGFITDWVYGVSSGSGSKLTLMQQMCNLGLMECCSPFQTKGQIIVSLVQMYHSGSVSGVFEKNCLWLPFSTGCSSILILVQVSSSSGH